MVAVIFLFYRFPFSVVDDGCSYNNINTYFNLSHPGIAICNTFVWHFVMSTVGQLKVLFDKE